MSCLAKFAQFLFVMLVLAVLASDASAQRRGSRGGSPFGSRGGRGIGPSTLLRNDRVQKELKIGVDQQEQIVTVLDESRAAGRQQFSGFRDLSDEQRREKMQQLRETFMARAAEEKHKLEEILNEAQRTRLQEITLQLRGISAVTDEQVAATLKISDDQKQNIEDLFAAQRDMQRELFSGMRDLPREERRTRFAEVREQQQELERETEKAVAEVLSDAQKMQLEEMKGEPFELDRSELFRGRRSRRSREGGADGSDV